MVDIVGRLQAIYPLLSEIFNISGAFGASLGVLHQGKVVYTASFAHPATKQSPTEHTKYYLASVTKAFTAAAVSILVDEGKLNLNDVVSDVLEEFAHPDPNIRQNVTISDILSHRTGLASKLAVWMGHHSRMLVSPEDSTKTATTLEPVSELRASFIPNNWLYGIAAQIVEKRSGESFASYVENHILRPQGLKNTTTHKVTNDSDLAYPHIFREDRDHPKAVTFPPIENGACTEGTVGVKSTVADLLIYYEKLLVAEYD